MKSLHLKASFLFISLLIIPLITVQSLAQSAKDSQYSFMFIIDNSASNSTDKTDSDGQRFKVTKELFDYIYEQNPDSKIGMVIFGSRLWFYGPDNESLFVSVPEDQYDEGDGCYIPPLDLNASYTGTAHGFDYNSIDYTLSGLELLKMYLDTVHKTMMGEIEVNLKYTPTHNPHFLLKKHSGRLTNITRAFGAANQAHFYQTPGIDKSKHINIFFSDGNAIVETDSPDKAFESDYIQGINTPSTITFFYNPSSNDLAKLNQMTENIKNNGYSESNSEITDIIALNDWNIVKERISKLFDDQTVAQIGTTDKNSVKTVVSYNVLTSGEISIESSKRNLNIEIYNIHGRKIRSLNSCTNSQDGSKIILDTKNNHNEKVASGRYLFKVKSGNNHFCKTLPIFN